MSKIFVIPDTQIKPETDLAFLYAIGKEIVEQQPDVIVNLGDFWDFPSLSSYDSNRKCEGRRLTNDLQAGHSGMQALLEPLRRLQSQQRSNKKKVYCPRMVFLLGNHENRLQRHIDSHPNLEGLIDKMEAQISKYGWETYPFLEPVTIEGVAYCHYFYAPMTGRPYGGMCATKLKNIGISFTQGHQQGIDWATLTNPDGTARMGLVAGSSYVEDEEYKGPQANHHWRGVVVKNNCENGMYDPEFISTKSLMEKWL